MCWGCSQSQELGYSGTVSQSWGVKTIWLPFPINRDDWLCLILLFTSASTFSRGLGKCLVVYLPPIRQKEYILYTTLNYLLWQWPNYIHFERASTLRSEKLFPYIFCSWTASLLGSGHGHIPRDALFRPGQVPPGMCPGAHLHDLQVMDACQFHLILMEHGCRVVPDIEGRLWES